MVIIPDTMGAIWLGTQGKSRGADPEGAIGAICNFIHHDFVQFGKQHSRSVACRGLVMPRALIGCPTSKFNSSIEQWRMVVIVTGYTPFVTSQYDVILTFANVRFDEVCWHNMHIEGRPSSGKAEGSKRVESNGNIKNKKSLPIMFVSVHQQYWLQI